MLADLSWNLFSRTGNPEAYLLYKEAGKDLLDTKDTIGGEVYGLSENESDCSEGDPGR